MYFVVLLLCGDWTLLNVFLAIACDSLDQVGDHDDHDDHHDDVDDVDDDDIDINYSCNTMHLGV